MKMQPTHIAIAVVVVLIVLLLAYSWFTAKKAAAAPGPPVPPLPPSPPSPPAGSPPCPPGQGIAAHTTWQDIATTAGLDPAQLSSCALNGEGEQWYYGGQPTCVAASYARSTPCPPSLACAEGDKGIVGWAADQMNYVVTASGSPGGVHPACPR